MNYDLKGASPGRLRACPAARPNNDDLTFSQIGAICRRNKQDADVDCGMYSITTM
jgi:hypothetical protein